MLITLAKLMKANHDNFASRAEQGEQAFSYNTCLRVGTGPDGIFKV